MGNCLDLVDVLGDRYLVAMNDIRRIEPAETSVRTVDKTAACKSIIVTFDNKRIMMPESIDEAIEAHQAINRTNKLLAALADHER